MKKEFTTLEKPFNAYATEAHHLLGEISRFNTPNPNPPKTEREAFDQIISGIEYNETDLAEHICSVYGDDGDNWVGSWITGMGYFDVRFPKSTTRPLTQEEIASLSKMKFRINDQPSFDLGDITTAPE